MGSFWSAAAPEPVIENVQIPIEESCETEEGVDFDAIHEALRPIVPRPIPADPDPPPVQEARPNNPQEHHGSSDDEDDVPPTPNVKTLRRFKIKAEGFCYGHRHVFTLMEDDQDRNNTRRWKRHLPSTVILKAVLKSGGYIKRAKYDVYLYKNNKKHLIGGIKGPGWLDQTHIIHAAGGQRADTMLWFKGLALYGRNLMTLHIRLPHIVNVNPDDIIQTLREATRDQYNPDIFLLIAEFLTPATEWARQASAPGEIPDDKLYDRFQNKVPRWNPGINAYTLEFGGRALLPSVHNFQLVRHDDHDKIHMQLGKLGTVQNCTYFNCDADETLSQFHAFAIAVGVLQRTHIEE